ncbi:MAG: toll/interleukin-1 receptor domain-containing protein [Gammaproteobacteria bacterium]|nr:toll/interleukin-1 receptor domain-containing protein [Gammaproteobacteria bacterium]
MSDIFISYAKDDRAKAQRIADALEGYGWSVFWDPEIPVGQTWRKVIDTEVHRARCVVVVWSERSIGSHWVLEEAEIGRQRDVLIPILIDKVLPPLGFQTFQAADLSAWDGAATDPTFLRLVSAITAILGPPPEKAKALHARAPQSGEATGEHAQQEPLRSGGPSAGPGTEGALSHGPGMYALALFRGVMFGVLAGVAFAYFDNLAWNIFSPPFAKPLSHDLPEAIGIGIGAVLALEVAELLFKAGVSAKILAFIAPVLIVFVGGTGGALLKTGSTVVGSSQIMIELAVLGCGAGVFAAGRYTAGSKAARVLWALGGSALGALGALLILLLSDNWGRQGSAEIYWYTFLSGMLPGLLLSAREILRKPGERSGGQRRG